MKKNTAALLILLLSAGLTAGCDTLGPAFGRIRSNFTNAIEKEAPGEVRLVAAEYDNVPGWKDDSIQEIIPMMLQTCETYSQRAPNEKVGVSDIAGTYGDWITPCRVLQQTVAADGFKGNPFLVRSYFEQWFNPYVVYNKTTQTGLFTGYYEAALNGSAHKSTRYSIPLYRRPGNLVSVNLGDFKKNLIGERIAGVVNDKGYLKPYYTREEIDRGALAGKGLELAWVDNPVDAFFVQIQGSGRINMDDGSVLRIGFDGANGHEYRSIGAELVAMNEMKKENVSMQSIRSWIEANPDKADKLLARNPSYIFFKKLDGANPVGSFGKELTPERSLAVDARFIPLGVPLWLDVVHPINPDHRIRKAVVAQDTGGAIRGAVRGDYFWGYGERAEYMAGMMKSEGRYWMFVPKTVKINP